MKTILYLIADRAKALSRFSKLLKQKLPNSSVISFNSIVKASLAPKTGEVAFSASKLLDTLALAIKHARRDTVIVKGLDWSKNPMAATLNNKAALAVDSHILFILSNKATLNSWLVTLTLAARYSEVSLWLSNECTCPPKLKPFLAGHFDTKLHLATGHTSVLSAAKVATSHRVTPTILRSYILTVAKRANCRIILPEPEDPRVMEAASYCQRHGIAQCLILGSKKKWQEHYVKSGAFTLDPNLTFIDPKANLDSYAKQYYELRKAKGVDFDAAKKAVLDPATLGMLMLKNGEAEGLVSGACHTTADTLRPAFQLIKTRPGSPLVSSAFLVCFPDEVRVMADCAVNPNPSSEELAAIAKQTYTTALSLGLSPKVALLSYSTIDSGKGPDVDLVKQAKELLIKEDSGFPVDGPLQYDAAIDPKVAKLKAPNSLIAGKANVIIFPNLTAGNIGYKIAQRSADLVCMGPILQGLNKPVNDLSRGCSVEDIVFTIALTALQAKDNS